MLSERMEKGLAQLKMAATGVPDHVPIVAQAGAHTMYKGKVKAREFLSRPELFVQTHLLVSEYYGFDAPSLTFDIYNIEAEAMGQKLVWIEGQLPEIDAMDHLIKEHRDLDKLRPPTPGKDGRMPFVIEFNKRATDLGFAHGLRYCAPFTLAANLRGLSNLVMDILLTPEWAHKLMTFLTEDVLAPYLQVMKKECGQDFAVIGADALASLPITNLDIINEYALGYTLRLRELVDKAENRAWWGERCLKNPEELMALKIKAQPSTLMAFDPDVHEIGSQRVKDFAVANDVLLMLGLDVSLLKGEDTRPLLARIEEYVAIGGRGGRFVLFFNDVPTECDAQRIHLAVQAANHFGSREYLEGNREKPFKFQPRETYEEWLAKR